MGMSTHVKGFKPPGEKWARMKAVWDACREAGVDVPGEVVGFFGDTDPDPEGVEIEESDLRNYGALREWKDEYRQGFEVLVERLPKDVTVIRFYNSW